MSISKYEGVVEVVVGVMIVRQNKFLLIQSPKWGDSWLFPGGHVEYGESLFQAAEREGTEETGLRLHAKYVIQVGENIFSPLYHRRSHMIFFHVVCEAESFDCAVDPREISAAEWIVPEEIGTKKIITSNIESIHRWQAKRQVEFEASAREEQPEHA